MTENEVKAIRFIENIKSHAMVTLDYIAKEEPNVSPLVYKGREEKADTILAMIEELQQYRAIGTPEELQDMKNNYFEALSDWRQYRKIGTLEECRAAMEKQIDEKPTAVLGIFGGTDYECKNCGSDVCYGDEYCRWCGQKLDWSDEE